MLPAFSASPRFANDDYTLTLMVTSFQGDVA
jgi:hypothetical protein